VRQDFGCPVSPTMAGSDLSGGEPGMESGGPVATLRWVSEETRSWPAGSATGVGSLPGKDIGEALRVVLDVLPELPYLPELPARGPGADLVGRGAALLRDLHVEVQPSGWRFADRPGTDGRRAVAYLRQDLDALEELTQGYAGALKIQAAGPWTLAAAIELRHGDKALSDPGACRDLAASLAEGLAAHVGEVRRRVPGAAVILQVDEPALPGVLRGSVPTASGFGALPAVDVPVAEQALREVIEAVRTAAAGTAVVVHCCAPGVPLALLRRAGAAAVSVDAALLTGRDEELGSVVEAGSALFLGVVPSADAPLSDPAGTVGGVRTLWRRIGLDPETLAETVVVTPTCGLAGASPAYARAAMRHSRAAAQVLLDDPEG
jgi:methionine synthase II (cobalamin-independent)